LGSKALEIKKIAKTKIASLEKLEQPGSNELLYSEWYCIFV
jgi:hypothetical protein